MKTPLNGQTIDLNITYTGNIDLTSDASYLYVLDTGSNYIDKYLKSSLKKQGNITYHAKIHDLIITYGEFYIYDSGLIQYSNLFACGILIVPYKAESFFKTKFNKFKSASAILLRELSNVIKVITILWRSVLIGVVQKVTFSCIFVLHLRSQFVNSYLFIFKTRTNVVLEISAI